MSEELSGLCVVCSTNSTLKCSRCANGIFYCSKEHQKSDWPNHKISCCPIKTVANHPQYPGLLTLVATRPIKKGEVFIKEKPFISGPRVHSSFKITSQQPRDPSQFPVCLGCLRAVKGNYKCSNCFWPLCSSACENEKVHREYECKIFAEHKIPPLNMDTVHEYTGITVLRLLLLREQGPKGHWEKLMKMKGCWEGIDLRRLGPDMVQVVKLTEDLLRRCHMKVEPALVDRVLRIYFGSGQSAQEIPPNVPFYEELCRENKARLGNYFFLNAAFVGQSCTPNSDWLLHFDKKGAIEIWARAHCDIAKGAPVTHSYMVDSMQPTVMRQQVLKCVARSCSCPRCLDPTELGSYFVAVKCKNCTKGYLLPKDPLAPGNKWGCDKCKFKCDSQMASDVISELQKEREVTQRVYGDRMIAPGIIEDVIAKYEGKLVHPNNFVLLQMKFDLLQMAETYYSLISKPENILFDNMEGGQVIDDDMRKKMIQRSKEAIALHEIVHPGLTRYIGSLAYFQYTHRLYFLRKEVKKGNLSPEEISRLRAEYEEVIELQQKSIEILNFLPEESAEYQQAQRLKIEPEDFPKMRSILGI